ncbi:uncharacterized protein PGTG_13545 [Puccinia graminis f. sp. tritici CRL 75-36-700-3]|uniref:Protein HGH1 homolog n=1 Tax=Puccinia graminis f. sp. tritici (strain CRL 75-36-700-3 / race SCCL) TaxID=418459 RepID=E3KTQ8_PUCGT|nr:uncharacterized protein PGTG_13545 [Puccinia graminis f. sp. tritici CRL 75-36-700-3]EFP87759.2 hypothetical protein PGTG_13545 [Puccinia graminis f. sp. tritici CRL 75-36-700-3]
MAQADEMGELIEFLHDRNPEVRRLAVHGLLPYTAANHPSRSILNNLPTAENSSGDLKPGSIKPGIIEDLKRLSEDQHMTAHDAFSALINLSDTAPVVEQLNDPDFLSVIFFTIIDHDSLLADLACMLLSNLTKLDSIVNLCLSSTIPPHTSHPTINQDESLSARLKKSTSPLMDLLIELFARGDRKQINPHANFDFLASVWANLSASPKGRDYLVGVSHSSTVTSEAPLFQLSPFTEHPSLIRRGGVISAIKNCCFATEVHDQLLSPTGFNLLPAILLPLMGPEALDDPEEQDEFPVECQLLGPDKRRETDPNLRLILVESLILLATYPFQREIMRKKKVYRIVQILHLDETSENVQESIERLVNLLMRDESEQGTKQIHELDDEDQLVEV